MVEAVLPAWVSVPVVVKSAPAVGLQSKPLAGLGPKSLKVTDSLATLPVTPVTVAESVKLVDPTVPVVGVWLVVTVGVTQLWRLTGIGEMRSFSSALKEDPEERALT